MECSERIIITVGSDKSPPSIEEVEVVYIPQRGPICNQAIKVIQAFKYNIKAFSQTLLQLPFVCLLT